MTPWQRNGPRLPVPPSWVGLALAGLALCWGKPSLAGFLLIATAMLAIWEDPR